MLSAVNKIIILSVVMLIVIMLRVVAPITKVNSYAKLVLFTRAAATVNYRRKTLNYASKVFPGLESPRYKCSSWKDDFAASGSLWTICSQCHKTFWISQ
jgi:hypothetical protein